MEALKYSPDQMQIMEFLERERRPMTAKEINDRLEFGSPSEVMSMMDQLVRDGHARNLIGDRYESVRTGLPYMSVDPLALVTQAQSLLAEGRPAQELLPSLKVALRALSSDGLKYRQVTASRLEPGDIVIVHEFGRPTEKMVDRVDFDGRGMYNIVFDDGTNERVNAYAPIDIKAAVPSYQAVSPSSPAAPAALAEALADGTLVKAVIENMTAKSLNSVKYLDEQDREILEYLEMVESADSADIESYTGIRSNLQYLLQALEDEGLIQLVRGDNYRISPSGETALALRSVVNPK